MPALGNRGVVSPTAIKNAAAKPAKPIRSLPAAKPPPKPVVMPAPPRSGVIRQAQNLSSVHHLNETLQAEAHPHPVKEAVKQVSSFKNLPQAPKASKTSGGGVLGTITNLPARVVEQGYRNLATATGVGALNKVGSLAAEAVNLPTQVLPSAYHLGHAVGQDVGQGKSQELHELVKGFAKESPIVHILKGDFKGAAEAAGHHPLGSALELSGVASAADRALGSIGRLSGVDAAKLADENAATVSRNPRSYPQTAVPEGGASVAQRPYHKGLVRPALEKKVTAKPIPEGRVPPNLKRSFDRFEGEQLRVTRATREMVAHRHAQTVKGVAGKDAVVPFGQWLADPAVKDAEGRPLYKQQLSEMAEHLSKPPAGEFPHEKAIRETNLRAVKNLQGKDLTGAYKAARQVAADKRGLEPELIQHRVYTPETIRAAKMIPAFRFHFRDQNPFVDSTVRPGESPFRLGGPEGRQVPVDEVARRLEEKGVHQDQLSFTSTRPFQNGNAPFRTGRSPGGARVAKGHLTGHAFMRGQFDITHDAALRQHLTDAGIINKARGDLRFSREYVHSRAQIAKLLEARVGRLPEEEQQAVRDYIQTELRSGNDLYFNHSTKGAGQRVLLAREHLKALYPDIKLEPIRVAHPYATPQYRQGMGRHLDLGATADRLDPENFGPEHDFWRARAPEETSALDDPSAGPVGLAHQEIRDRVRRYEKDLGQAHLSRMPASFWRRTNVAFSVRHIPGVTQEIGARAAAYNIGPLSYMRGTRALSEIARQAQENTNPFVKLGAQRYQAMVGGTVAANTEDLARHATHDQLMASKARKAVELWDKGVTHKVTGPPLKALQGAVHLFNRSTTAIIRAERKGIEHPPQIAGAGKHFNQEFQRLHGQRLKLLGEFSDLEKQFLRGQLDPKAIDHAAGAFREYWGDWSRASPEFKNFQRVSPFAQWYLNSLRFIYHTMPIHHPVKTGLITAIEGATREKRLAEGQEYKGGFPLGSHLLPTDLEPSQQGSLPYGKGERAGQEYYTPQGAISAGPLESVLGGLFPYASGIYLVSRGINPLTDRPLEEKVEGKKQPITDANQLALLAALSAGESFLPPIRYAQALGRKPAGYVFRPLRTEHTRLEKPAKKTKTPSLKLGTSLGGLGSTKLGSSLK